MKKEINTGDCPIKVFKTKKRLTKSLAILLAISFLNLTVSCSYYNVKDITTSPEVIANQIEDFNASQGYAIIHSGENIWHLANLKLNEDDKTISGLVQTLHEEHKSKKLREKKRVHRYKMRKQQPLNELHFNLTTNTIPHFGKNVTIPFSDIASLSINDKNTGRSVVNAVFGTIGILFVTLFIYAALKSSCPFIYVKNGDEFIFTGELYPGVIMANLERNDYLPLPYLKPENDVLGIKITNELKEIQHTDLVQLIVAEHPENTTILLDNNGFPHSFSSISAPNKVIVDNLSNDLKTSLKKDNISYLFDTEIASPKNTRHIEIEFEKPALATQAKLFITAKNSMWLDYIFGKFNEQFGTYYQKFQKDQQSVSKEKSLKWINEQNIPLSVYLKTINGWELIDRINTVGPMASRDIVIPIDIEHIKTDKLEIKLESGFKFWEVDYVGIDFSKNIPIKLHNIAPSEAFDQDNKDVTTLLSKADQKYFVQPNIGDEVIVTFKINMPSTKLKASYFLKNKGYYNYIRDYKGMPNFGKLKLFKETGAFTEFSKYEYEALMDYDTKFDLAISN